MKSDPMVTPGERRYGAQTGEERRAERRARLLVAGLEVFGGRGYQSSSAWSRWVKSPGWIPPAPGP